ncbi:MAG TPA: biotin carboxylase N-terminal domain-containing protein [Steroidobacteraceae bacterium]|nr:biotin carboxylase N-terminal domain-containing protein [Steroidobacteraceae bacterium]
MFRKLLIANRGEIACRIGRTARALGIETVAVYSDADVGARHVRLADEAWPLGPAPAVDSYLSIGRVLGVARECGADAIHPGYGFLSENAEFAARCAAAGVVFVGPSPEAIAAMGAKAAAKARMQRAGIPVLPGYQEADQALATLERAGQALGFPLIIKPSGGGGGKGMQIVSDPAALRGALEAARRLAGSAFGDPRLLLERYLAAPRHVEVQVLADGHGHVLHLHDRDCSVQRRHQKLIEEAPAPRIAGELRAQLAAAACAVAREIGYVGAGTVEFLLERAEFFFMEMNTRLQVEHPVTEAITGLDLVEWQLRIAAGEPLSFAQQDIEARGHAIEVRICAEDAARDFLPGAGKLSRAQWPEALAGVRVDAGFDTGDCVPSHYDSLLGKVIAHGGGRDAALERLRAALKDTRIAGVPSNVTWLAAALDTPVFRNASMSTAFVTQQGATLGVTADAEEFAPFAAAAQVFAMHGSGANASPWATGDGFRLSGAAAIAVALSLDKQRFTANVRTLDSATVAVSCAGSETPPLQIIREPLQASAGESTSRSLQRGEGAQLLRLRSAQGGAQVEALVSREAVDLWCDWTRLRFVIPVDDLAAAASRRPAGSLTSMLPGVVVSVLVAQGDHVQAGAALLVIEAMKMEHTIQAPQSGIVKALNVRTGDRVNEGAVLLEMEGA